MGLGVGLAVTLGDGLSDGLSDVLGDVLGEAETDGVGLAPVADGEGIGCGARPLSTSISMGMVLEAWVRVTSVNSTRPK